MSIQRLVTATSLIASALLFTACAAVPQSSGITIQAGGGAGSGSDSGGGSDDSTEVGKDSDSSGGSSSSGSASGSDGNESDSGAGNDKPSEAELKGTAFYVGNCVTFDVSDGKVTHSSIVDCSKEHRSEVYFVGYLDAGAYPGDESIDKEVHDVCQREFKGYVGVDSKSSEFRFSFLTPNRDTWGPNARDRMYNCMLEKEESQLWTGSAKDSKK